MSILNFSSRRLLCVDAETHQMVEFVANYRRSNNISGKLSYSNLYTSISVLAGHYASYGPKFPVPEKRRKRLMQVG